MPPLCRILPANGHPGHAGLTATASIAARIYLAATSHTGSLFLLLFLQQLLPGVEAAIELIEIGIAQARQHRACFSAHASTAIVENNRCVVGW